jgi:putative transposase
MMRKSKFSEAQIVAILREGEAGLPLAEILRKHGISRPTYYLWKQKYGEAGVPELQRLNALEQENAQFKRMYAELALENTAIKDVLTRRL